MLFSKFQAIGLAALVASAQGRDDSRFLKGKKSNGGNGCPSCCTPEEFSYTADKTFREGLGESPGVTAFEYLGTGYNLFEGNPRGGEATELDPGFRAGVIQLEQDQSVLTIDGVYTVPLGTEIRYVTSCQFDSKSKEMTSASDYESELRSEASETTTFGIGASFLGFSFGFQSSFSESFKSKSFARDRLETQTTAFEAKALCTEFEGRLKRYYDHKPTTDFAVALETLPPFLTDVTLDENFNPASCPNDDDVVLSAYRSFVAEFGTHYIVQVMLGAKHVFTTVMKSQDVLRLREQEVEVETALSAKAMFGYSREVEVEASIPIKGVEVSVATTLVTEGTIEGGREESTYESQRAKSIDELKQKTQTVTEVNIGGTPPPDGDWRTWAATAKDRPMPITYEMSSLADLMDQETAESFAKALRCLYRGEVLNLPEFPSAVRFGLADPNGNPISTYSYDPFSDQRTVALLRPPQVTDSDEANPSSPPLFNYDIRWFGSARRVSALFASPIRDNVSPNTREDEKELGFLDDRFTNELSIRSNLHSFGLFPEPGRSFVGVLDYGTFDTTREASSRSQLNTFAYLTADNLGEDGIVAGVVHPQGYAVNREFGVDPRFSIDQQNDHTFFVNLPQSPNVDVTFVAFPMWFPSTSNRYPKNSGEIAIGVDSCQSDNDGARCKIQVGARQSKVGILNGGNQTNVDVVKTDQFLGFSFLAIDDKVSQPGLVHGVIEITPGTNPTVTVVSGSGDFNATGKWDTPPNGSFDVVIGNVGSVNVSATVSATQVTGGVLIEFENPFSELPAVFASISNVTASTERFENKALDGGILETLPIFGWEVEAELVKGPSVVVEHVNEKQVFIKAGMVDTCIKQNSLLDTTPVEIYEPKSFHFVAAGPVLQN